ncbi:hypothetical protein [Methylorubrum suomiense]|nr:MULTISPECIES: hypothetical protein [Methylobacteriaceae]
MVRRQAAAGHQYEEAVWEEADTWDFHRAELGGSSYYVLPHVL